MLPILLHGRSRSAAQIAITGLALTLAGSGCSKKTDNTANFKSAVDTYYSARPVCLWDAPKKFPVQAGAGDSEKTSDYDALVDQGLLSRSTAEKKRFLIGSKDVVNYDIADKGRGAWTADPNQPGYGNFCYGHRKVASIVSATPTTSDVGATTQVNYQYAIDDVAGWAKATAVQTAFPQVQADLNGQQTGQATLTNTSNGWQVTSAPAAGRSGVSGTKPATSADGKIVQ